MDPSSFFTAVIMWIVLLPSLYIIGSFFSNYVREESFLLRGVIYLGLGFGVLSYYMISIGYVNLMKPMALVLPLGGILFFRRSKINEFRKWFFFTFREVLFKHENYFQLVLQFVFAISLLITFLACFLPEISGDALAHHLALPKRYLQRGLIAPVPYDFKSYQSILMNALYVIGLMFKSVPAAKLFHWWAGVLLTFSLTVFTHRITQHRSVAIFSGLMLWLTPTFMIQVSTTYVDIGVSFFLFLSFYLFWQALENKKEVYFLLSGMLLGFAANCKYSGLLGIVPFAVAFLFWRFKSQRFKSALSFSSGFLVLGGFLFIRNWILTGNPIFPTFSSFIGKRVSSELTHDLLYELGPLGNDPVEAIVSFFLIPWNFTFNPVYATASLSFTPSFKVTLGEWMGPLYAVPLSFALYGIFFFFKDRLIKFCGFFIFFYLTGWFFMGQYMRYLLPIFPICLIVSAVLLTQILNRYKRWKRVLSYACMTVTVFLFLILVYHFRHQYKSFLGLQSYDAYIRDMERTYSVAGWINQKLPSNAKILSADEFRLFYFNPETIRWVMLYRHPEYPNSKNPDEIARFFKSIGITHILSAEQLESSVPIPQAEGRRELNLLLSDAKLVRKLVTVDSQNVREGKYRYIVYQLAENVK